MERFIADLVKDFDAGRISRRQFCEGVAVAATVFAAGGAAEAAPAKGFKLLGVNHVSYSCAEYTKARDFYRDVLGMQVINDNGKSRANLAFGPAPGKGGQFLVARNFGANPPKRSQSIVDHVCYTIADWDDARVNAALSKAGLHPNGRHGSVNVFDPYGFQCQLASIEGENPFI
jgi:catechol 2,3-dioxygenase-like lactoylglutathione lyase family enzyme